MKRTVELFIKFKAGKTVAALTAIVTLFVILFSLTPVSLADDKAELPYGGDFGPCEIYSRVKGFSQYSATNMMIIGGEEAEKAGVPEGYKNNVITMDPSINPGVTFDFSAAKINVYSIKSISFKIYIESTEGDISTGDTHYPEIRIPYPGATNTWVVRYDASSRTDKWITVTINPAGANMVSDVEKICGSDNALMALAGEDCYLGMFELAVRRHDGKGAFYIDSVIINYMPSDKTGPVLTYRGEDSIKLAKGSQIILDAEAYDENEKRNCPVKTGWDESAVLEEDGYPAVGTKTVLVLSAEDAFGNVTEKRINVEVLPEDKTAPEIAIGSESLKCLAGTYPGFHDGAKDDMQVLSVEYTWGEGALDSLGRLNQGTFELHVKAVDTSGNVTEKTFTVTAGGPEIFSGFTVTEDTRKK